MYVFMYFSFFLKKKKKNYLFNVYNQKYKILFF